jgi:hypothetical protein
MARVVKVTHQKIDVNRVPRGEKPEVDIPLDDNQQLLEVKFGERTLPLSDRKTVDWTVFLTIATTTEVGS